eukprot:TRINITY_DN32803_c0_g1_i6.p1 TRINITY_DN32803_c0_g1~~TRINITY_DN32803_c0_g1_i6.p1  ORF type:complete len:496 (-),score=40.76 TRINITY_DN32803_c0_g1_i6:55-1542(-)
MTSGFAVVPAWTSDDADDVCSFTSLPTCAPTVTSKSPSRVVSPFASPRRGCGGPTSARVCAELQSDLEDVMKRMLEDVQKSFSKEMQSRLRMLESDLEVLAPDQKSNNGDVLHDNGSARADGPRLETKPSKSNAFTKWRRQQRAVRKPIELPRGELQAGTIAADMSRGRAQAQEVLLAAGFLGGAGRIMQAFWFVFGGYFVLWALASDDTKPWHVGDCGLVCLFMRFLLKLRWFSLGSVAFARCYFLHAEQHARAHWAILVGTFLWISTSTSLGLLSLYLGWVLDCGWRDDGFFFHGAGSACSTIGLIDSTIMLALMLPFSRLLWALWSMRLKYASDLFLHIASLFCVWPCCYLLVIVYLGGESLEHVPAAASSTILPVTIILTVWIRRHFNKKKAWRGVAQDADAYDQLWREILQEQVDSVKRLSEASKQVMADIDRAAMEGPQCELCEAENLRRTLLQYNRRQPSGLRQSLSSLPLLFAQAGRRFRLLCFSSM